MDQWLKPDLIPSAYAGVRYDGPVDVSVDGPLRWHETSADMERVFAELRRGPVLIEVDYKPGGEFNQHFVVGLEWDEVRGDVLIADPWDGARCFLLERYSLIWAGWDLARSIYGLRLLRRDDE